VAHFDGVLYGVPNAELLLSPLTTQEAVLSSRIEGTQATLGEVLRFEAGELFVQEERREDIREILNYRRALGEAEQVLKAKPFTLNLLLKLHDTLLSSVRGRDKGRGQFRRQQNWVGRHNTPMQQAEFVPPPQFVPELMDNWEKYYHADRPDPLVQLAVLHAQFEIIHPFLDGNGRLDRIIIPLFLCEKKLLSRPMFYLSGWLEERRDQYITHLRNLGRSDGAWNRWIEFFLSGIEEQAGSNAQIARSVTELYSRVKKRILDVTHSRYAIPLLDQIFARPIFQSTAMTFGPATPTRAAMAGLVRALRESGILTVVHKGSGRRPATYALAELVNLCEGKQVL
jgi:Fic family protein